MKSAAIYLHGLPAIDKPIAIKTVRYENEESLRKHLQDLQAGYLDNDIVDDGEEDQVIISEHTTIEGKTILDCHSQADWHHVAFIGMKIKEESKKPVETLV